MLYLAVAVAVPALVLVAVLTVAAFRVLWTPPTDAED